MQRKKSPHILICQCVHQFRLAPRELHLTLKHLHCLFDFTLLQAELCERRHRRFAIWVDPQCLVTASLSSPDVLLPLVECESFVD